MTRRDALAIAVPLVAGTLRAQSRGTGKERGSVMAPVHMELYSDYQCPSCKIFHEQTLKPLLADYVEKGKVYLINREFPLPMHQYAREAAALACAAGHVGRYELVADNLFAKQDDWSKTGKYEDAALTGLSAAEAKKVRELAHSSEVKAEVEKDFQLAKGKIQSTPTAVLTHKGKTYPVSGAVSYAIFRRFIDELLTK